MLRMEAHTLSAVVDMVADFSGQVQNSYLGVFIAGVGVGKKNILRISSSLVLNFWN